MNHFCPSGAGTHPTGPPRFARLAVTSCCDSNTKFHLPASENTLKYRTTGQAKLGVGICLQETNSESNKNVSRETLLLICDSCSFALPYMVIFFGRVIPSTSKILVLPETSNKIIKLVKCIIIQRHLTRIATTLMINQNFQTQRIRNIPL